MTWAHFLRPPKKNLCSFNTFPFSFFWSSYEHLPPNKNTNVCLIYAYLMYANILLLSSLGMLHWVTSGQVLQILCGFLFSKHKWWYHSTWSNSTPIILFSEMLKFLNFFFPKIFFLKENKESDGMFGNISFTEMESSILIN